MEGVVAHVIVSVKNSRYDWQKIKRRKPVGFITRTFPFFENKEEELLIRLLCETAIELGLTITAFNFCGDHVHAIIVTDNTDISRIIGLWKGKSAFIFNRHMKTINNNDQPENLKNDVQNLWAKGFYRRIIKFETEFENVIHYVNTNRRKHGISPLTESSVKLINTLTIYQK